MQTAAAFLVAALAGIASLSLLLLKPKPKSTQEIKLRSPVGKFVNIGSQRIHYLLLKPALRNATSNKTLAIYVHGLGGQVHQWVDIMERCRENVACSLAFDFTGHGHSSSSSVNDHYKLDHYMHLISCMVKVAQEETKIDFTSLCLVGHSYGSVVSCAFSVSDAASNLPKISSIILVAPKAYFTKEELGKIAYLRYLPPFLLDLLRLLDTRGGTESISVRRMLSPSASTDMKAMQLAYNRFTPKQTLLGMRNIKPTLNSLYTSINAKVVIVSPMNDVTCPPHKNGKLIVKELAANLQQKQDVYELERLGHNIMLQAPLELSNIILKHI